MPMLLQNHAHGRMDYMEGGTIQVVGRLTTNGSALSGSISKVTALHSRAAGVWIRGLPKLLPASHTWTNINLLRRANSFYTCTNSSRLRVIQEHSSEFVQ
jgi:hypothetical protein